MIGIIALVLIASYCCAAALVAIILVVGRRPAERHVQRAVESALADPTHTGWPLR